MKPQISEAEILAIFQTLGIATDEERQRALFTVSYSDAVKMPESVRFDIGFNATLPNN
jgi:hypothetical protein